MVLRHWAICARRVSSAATVAAGTLLVARMRLVAVASQASSEPVGIAPSASKTNTRLCTSSSSAATRSGSVAVGG